MKLESLPVDIFIQIVNHLDSKSKLELGLVSKHVSVISLKELWYWPICQTRHSFRSILITLSQQHGFYPYQNWLYGLMLSNIEMTVMPAFDPIPFECLTLNQIQKIDNHSLHILLQPALKSVELHYCSEDVVLQIATYLGNLNTNIQTIYIMDSYIDDFIFKSIVYAAPQLRHFCSERSGYVGDSSIQAISSHCPLLESLVLTLPSHFIQSNTITTLDPLSNCLYLKNLICKGQIRISNEKSKSWLFKHCPNLIYCDLSF